MSSCPLEMGVIGQLEAPATLPPTQMNNHILTFERGLNMPCSWCGRREKGRCHVLLVRSELGFPNRPYSTASSLPTVLTGAL
jgi:hypothetical protein